MAFEVVLGYIIRWAGIIQSTPAIVFINVRTPFRSLAVAPLWCLVRLSGACCGRVVPGWLCGRSRAPRPRRQHRLPLSGTTANHKSGIYIFVRWG